MDKLINTLEHELKLQKIGRQLLSVLGLASLGWLIFLSPINQPESYHHFSDTSSFLGLPHFWNIISNLPFLFVGIYGLLQLNKMNRNNHQFRILFIGVIGISIGSGYYHYFPNDDTLIWDRLPMTTVFMGFMSIVISECIHRKIGKNLFFPLLILGAVSIVYWIVWNDIRLYAVVQFYPVFAIPIILICFRTEHFSPKGFWLLVLFYVFAKVCETFDSEIHQYLVVISGHSLKHIVASSAIYFWINDYITQHQLSQKSPIID